MVGHVWCLPVRVVITLKYGNSDLFLNYSAMFFAID